MSLCVFFLPFCKYNPVDASTFIILHTKLNTQKIIISDTRIGKLRALSSCPDSSTTNAEMTIILKLNCCESELLQTFDDQFG